VTAELPDVRPDQIWADNDWRSEGRQVKVLEIVERDGQPYARVEVIAAARGSIPVNPKKPRITLIAVRRFRPNSTGYRLVQDAET